MSTVLAQDARPPAAPSPAAQQPETLPQHFMDKVQRYGPSKIALRQKEFGIWREYSWEESYQQLRHFALGLIALGLRRGDPVCGIGDNDREYLWAWLGSQAVGGVQVGLFTDATPDEIAYIVNHCQAPFVLAQDQEQCDKLLAIKDRLTAVKRVIYWDEKGLWYYDDDWLISFEDVQALGQTLSAREPDRFDIEVALGRADDLATITYTSGTTGLPKGAMLTHDNLLHAAQLYQAVDPRIDTDNHVSFLPLGWIGELILGIVPHVYVGLILNFPEEPETVRDNIREIAPEGIFYNSRLWDNLVATVQVRMNDASWINRRLYQLFLPVGYRMADASLGRSQPGLALRLVNALGDRLIFASLRDQLGMSRIRSAYTAGSALSPDAMRFFHALGINLKQIFGASEVSGGATLHRDGDIKFASVGPPAPGIDIRISDEGEILIAGPTVFKGYLHDPEATAEAVHVDEDGKRWFRTGDAGYIDDDGHLIYLDRLKDMITLANAERFSPQFIEGRLKFSPYVRDVMAVGGETRDFVTALIIIDFENVGHWAEKRGLGYTTFLDLSQKAEVYDLISKAVSEVNQSLPPAGRVRRFVLMHKEFDADEAEMTRTRKLRRGYLYDRYGNMIEAMYAGEEAINVRAAVRYRDGREGVVETNVKIMSL
ncbi:MAG: AMP-binding protein [Candidatus Promineifilaceae bacterium]|nr:AMP-binding protein [Candidatus Promineifilaceae bacterium]